MAYEQEDISFTDEEDNGFHHAPTEWRTYKLAFGKNKGVPLSEMIKTARGRSYLRYILKWDDVRPNTSANINSALAYYRELKQAKVGRRSRGLSPPIPPTNAPVLKAERSWAEVPERNVTYY